MKRYSHRHLFCPTILVQNANDANKCMYRNNIYEKSKKRYEPVPPKMQLACLVAARRRKKAAR